MSGGHTETTLSAKQIIKKHQTCISTVHICYVYCVWAQVYKRQEDRKRQTERMRAAKDRQGEREIKREGETFLPYVPRILGQLVAEYLKDAVYLTCGRQLLTLCCSNTNTQRQAHRQTYTYTFTHVHAPHTLFMMQAAAVRAHSCTYTKIPTHTHTRCTLHAATRQKSN